MEFQHPIQTDTQKMSDKYLSMRYEKARGVVLTGMTYAWCAERLCGRVVLNRRDPQLLDIAKSDFR